MTKTYKNLAIFFTFLAMLIFPFSIWGSIVVGILATVCGVYFVKETRFSYRIMQPVLILFSVIAVMGIYHLIMGPITYFASINPEYVTSSFYNFVRITTALINGISSLWLLVWGVIGVVCFTLDKDIPLYDKFSEHVMGIVSKKDENKKPSEEHTDEDDIDPIDYKQK